MWLKSDLMLFLLIVKIRAGFHPAGNTLLRLRRSVETKIGQCCWNGQ